MRNVWIASLVLASGCASVPVALPPAFPAQDVAQADGRVLEGCYTCLIAARDTYARLATGPFRAELLPKLFEVQLLLLLRHKELAMPFDEARTDAARTAEALPVEFEAPRYLTLVDLVAPDPLGMSRREVRDSARVALAFRPHAAAEIAFVAAGTLGDPVRRYLELSLRCTAGLVPAPRQAAPLIPKEFPPDEPPLLTYRAGTCGGSFDPIRLEVVRAQVEEFHEASYFLTRNWLNDSLVNGTAKWAAAIGDLQPRFPTSSAVTFSAAIIEQADGDCETALTFYDRTLALRPMHEDAMLGRVMCLSHLGRTDEAIATATDLIAAGGDTLSLAYYWRSWNRHRLAALVEAREDITAAKKARTRPDLETIASIHLLAGIIEHDQDDLEPAMTDLRIVVDMTGGKNCTAPWYIALVHIKRREWPRSAASFENAMDCYARTVADARRGLDVLRGLSDIEPVFRARRIATLEAIVVEGERQRHASAMNAAKSFANAGDFRTAVRLGTIAMGDPELVQEVDVLRAYLAEQGAAEQLPPSDPAIP